MSKRKSRVGAFFGGSFFGFILCLALIAGLGCFVYFKVSPNWINKTFKTNIDFGSDETNNKTVKDFVKSTVNLTKNLDTYTINNLNDDFGVAIKDELFGLDISGLKDVPLKNLSKEIESTFANISADELRNVQGMNLETNMGKILNKENIYYFNSADGKLYKKYDGTTYSGAVKFAYEINASQTTVTTKGNTELIEDGKVKIPLWYLPLTHALTDFTSNLGNQTTLFDLEDSYGVKLPSFLKNVDKQNTTVNELESVIKTVKVGEILDANIKLDSQSQQYYDDKDNDDVFDAGEEIAYVLKAISETSVEDLDSLINNFTFSQIFNAQERAEGVLSLITTDPTIAELPTAIESAVSQTSIEKLIEKGIITVDSEDMTKLSVPVDHDKDSTTEKVTLKSLTIDEFIDYCLDLVPSL